MGDGPRIVLGLGNPGSTYRATRHNIGFRVVDRLAERLGVRLEADGPPGRRAWHAAAVAGDERIVLARPRTYMNRSGRAALALLAAYGGRAEEMIVVYDDADLELGRIRIRPEGGSGGHNGIRSLIDATGGGGFARIRVGIRGAGRDDRELADYVLEPFEPDEEPLVGRLVELAADATLSVCRDGVQAAMNGFNGRHTDDDGAGRETRDG